MNKYILIMIFLVFLNSCSKKYKPAEDAYIEDLEVASVPLLHVVSSRKETLGYIAEWYTGDFENWKTIASFNNKNNSIIRLGESLFIPHDLVIREDELDINSLLSTRVKYRRSQPSRKIEETKSDEPTREVSSTETQKNDTEELNHQKEIEEIKETEGEKKVEENETAEVLDSVKEVSKNEIDTGSFEEGYILQVGKNKKNKDELQDQLEHEENQKEDILDLETKKSNSSKVREEDPINESERIRLLHELLSK